MYLIIDIGNSLHKWAVFSPEGNVLESQRLQNLTVETVRQILNRYTISHSICSAVGHFDESIVALLQTHTHYVRFSCDTHLPIELCYETPHTLGLDRIANAVGASTLFPQQNVLSIQVGTCLVFDLVNSKGQYLGGSISPGLEMRFKALHHFTEKLPYVKKREIDFFIGNSTQHSIESGVIHGMIDEINGAVNRYDTVLNDLKIILTGGDAEFFHNSIKSAIFAPQNLVLLGLYKILLLNAENA